MFKAKQTMRHSDQNVMHVSGNAATATKKKWYNRCWAAKEMESDNDAWSKLHCQTSFVLHIKKHQTIIKGGKKKQNIRRKPIQQRTDDEKKQHTKQMIPKKPNEIEMIRCYTKWQNGRVKHVNNAHYYCICVCNAHTDRNVISPVDFNAIKHIASHE